MYLIGLGGSVCRKKHYVFGQNSLDKPSYYHLCLVDCNSQYTTVLSIKIPPMFHFSPRVWSYCLPRSDEVKCIMCLFNHFCVPFYFSCYLKMRIERIVKINFPFFCFSAKYRTDLTCPLYVGGRNVATALLLSE